MRDWHNSRPIKKGRELYQSWSRSEEILTNRDKIKQAY
ncbi:hypothetical Protein YC6258_04345 [Gynuella sunshinyii YC6258]|uniref:Uncharacterized protein n=1 Tax=Gynuella sunshinyii YC6258 TaxID=1445510 RepID=A0A0C5VNY1_9GAMM|nr:hypothetical Protein YC6258_04345 [Gynuella sunshinyii YC6258]